LSITTRTRIVLVQHVLELSERSNTGRHAAAALEHLDLRIFGAKDVPLKVDDLQGAWLLWPGEPEPPDAVPRPTTDDAARAGVQRAAAVVTAGAGRSSESSRVTAGRHVVARGDRRGRLETRRR
jgi:hypothetical protein